MVYGGGCYIYIKEINKYINILSSFYKEKNKVIKNDGVGSIFFLVGIRKDFVKEILLKLVLEIVLWKGRKEYFLRGRLDYIRGFRNEEVGVLCEGRRMRF